MTPSLVCIQEGACLCLHNSNSSYWSFPWLREWGPEYRGEEEENEWLNCVFLGISVLEETQTPHLPPWAALFWLLNCTPSQLGVSQCSPMLGSVEAFINWTLYSSLPLLVAITFCTSASTSFFHVAFTVHSLSSPLFSTHCFVALLCTRCSSAFVGKYSIGLGHLSNRPLKRNTDPNCASNSEAINQFVSRYRGLLSIELWKKNVLWTTIQCCQRTIYIYIINTPHKRLLALLLSSSVFFSLFSLIKM